MAAVRRRIVVVDDDHDTVFSTLLMLRLRGHDVVGATSAGAALEKLRVFEPDVMLIDIGMPYVDGWQLARRIRSDAEFSRSLLVAVTGYGRLEDAKRSREAGFNGHLLKPVPPELLDTVLAELKVPKGRLEARATQ